MANLLRSITGWFRSGSNALTETTGTQFSLPSTSVVNDGRTATVDTALQLSSVWSCVERRANVVASLPLFLYKREADGQKTLDRDSQLYRLLHDSPNYRMTAYDFWRAVMLNHDLRGNGFVRIDRNAQGEAVNLWPMPADQVESVVMDDGSMVYVYRVGSDVAVLAEENVLHLRNLGNGTTGFAKLDYMRASVNEALDAQGVAGKLFANGGKPSGLLMLDSVLSQEQRDSIRARFAEMALGGSTGRLFVLEAGMKYQALNMTPQDQQLLETRQFSVEEICRWFDVPPVLIHHSNVTTWGSGVETIIDGWHKLSIRPILVSIEQALTKRVLTARQRASMSVEFNFDALLRGSAKDRAELYAKHVQNGIMTRNECRQLENLPPVEGANELTAQVNLVPVAQLGKVEASANAATQNPVAQ